MSVLWRVFAVNAAVIVAAAVALVATPATVSDPIATTEAVVVIVGIVATLVLDLVLLRRVLGPLRALATFVRSVEPLAPGARAAVPEAEGEVRDLAIAINEMLDRVEDERRESARRALAVQERERVRIARELHDEVGQVLTAAVLSLQQAAQHAPADVGALLGDTREAVRTALDDVRGIARRLRPEALDDLGLRAALTAMASEVERASGLDVRRDIAPHLDDLPDDVQLVAYRVAQEALTNVLRHARARTATLTVQANGDRLEVRVTDDGQGLAAGHVDGAGLRGMRERALLVGGRLDVHEAEGGGTVVELRVPLEPPA